MTMLEYFKVILQKVSFDQNLFGQELKKAIRDLVTEEAQELKKWCVDTFGLSFCQTADPGFSI